MPMKYAVNGVDKVMLTCYMLAPEDENSIGCWHKMMSAILKKVQ